MKDNIHFYFHIQKNKYDFTINDYKYEIQSYINEKLDEKDIVYPADSCPTWIVVAMQSTNRCWESGIRH